MSSFLSSSRLGVIAAVFLTSFSAASVANACSCMRPEKGPIEQLRQGAVVALGVAKLKSGNPAGPGIRYAPVRYELRVKKSLGARLPRVVTVETADNSAACGVDLRGRGEVMLLLSPAEKGVRHVNLCGQLSVDAFAEDWRTLFDAMPR